jgi:diacylglycerol kinase (ATP)
LIHSASPQPTLSIHKKPETTAPYYRSCNLGYSFYYAWQGIVYTFKTQRNFKIHLMVGLMVLLSSSLLHVGGRDLAMVISLIGLVLAAELLNTAIEATVDLITEGRLEPKAKIAKDAAAAAVTVLALCAALAGSLILAPYLFKSLYSLVYAPRIDCFLPCFHLT